MSERAEGQTLRPFFLSECSYWPGARVLSYASRVLSILEALMLEADPHLNEVCSGLKFPEGPVALNYLNK